MSTPFSVSVSISFSRDTSQPETTTAFALSDTFEAKDDDIYDLTGAGVESITLKGQAKLLFIKVAADAAAAEILVELNGGSDQIEIPPGGSKLIVNPAPSAGVTSLVINHTTANKVTLVALS
jgi:hypothetical protein